MLHNSELGSYINTLVNRESLMSLPEQLELPELPELRSLSSGERSGER